ncbi:hypothetical protein QNJ95_43995 [Bradyrhizobium elkanii]|uniref:hypothetical protein n=1 Tax=Bradyrhizobium elkanii TaxID=29448 RepID=UPI002711F476|nr:hypothetical protein [Bradyrhizobium elkanii]WLA39727.1 hypothetical protein QNJ95_43995 [Bradyrhizobium elkanii]
MKAPSNTPRCLDWLVGDGGHTIATEMKETSVKGLHYIDVRNDKGETTKAELEIKFKRIAVLSRREAETLSSPRPDDNPCHRARYAKGP